MAFDFIKRILNRGKDDLDISEADILPTQPQPEAPPIYNNQTSQPFMYNNYIQQNQFPQTPEPSYINPMAFLPQMNQTREQSDINVISLKLDIISNKLDNIITLLNAIVQLLQYRRF